MTKLRLRDGESNLLAGLLQEEERRSLRGFPGILRLPIIKQLFSANDNTIEQTDIVMLLTPRIVRTHELTARDLTPIFIGTQQNLGAVGPPPSSARSGSGRRRPPAPHRARSGSCGRRPRHRRGAPDSACSDARLRPAPAPAAPAAAPRGRAPPADRPARC